MSAPVDDQMEEIARRAKAIVRCEFCRNYVAADDPDAEARAYASATDAWEHGGFQGASLEDVRDLLTSVLKNADRRCPSCERS
jgi:hypothetical protein